MPAQIINISRPYPFFHLVSPDIRHIPDWVVHWILKLFRRASLRWRKSRSCFNPGRSIDPTFQSLPGARFIVNDAAQA
jgi:hypothetical protein